MSVMSMLSEPLSLSALPRGRALTNADLELVPDDTNKYELIDGVLFVSAAPNHQHAIVAERLAELLRAAKPDGWWTFTTAIGVEFGTNTHIEPDIVVHEPQGTTRADAKRFVKDPALVVEVLSPSTALTDLNVKHKRLERAGVRSYWVIDPRELRLIVWELRDGAYVEVADVTDGSWTAALPFEVTITPSTLLD